MTSLKLRPYQRETIAANFAAWTGAERPTGTGTVNRTASVLATGLGKTVTFTEMIRQFIAARPRERAAIYVHREELAEQAAKTVHSVAPGLSVGVVKAHRNEIDRQVLICSIPTLVRPERREQVRDIGFQVYDECHHAAAPSGRTVLEHFGAYRGVPTAGFTATLNRDDGLGLGEVWQEVVIERDIAFGIKNGFLVPVAGKLVQIAELDLTGVHVRGGDLDKDEVGKAMLNADAGNAIAKAVLDHASDRQGMIFAPNVATAEEFAEEMCSAGMITEVITGATRKREREAIFQRTVDGDTQYISNCMVLTEGFDMPLLSCAVVARPTRSQSLYIQMVGRVLRPALWAGKRDALVLDVVGASTRHGLQSISDLSPDAESRELDDEFGVPDLGAADEELDVEGWEEPARRLDLTRMEVVDVDLFAQSDSRWLQTAGGKWFIPADEVLFFLWPAENGLFHVGMTPIAKAVKATVLQNSMTFELAMAWAERYADEQGGYTQKRAGWRTRAMSEAQIRKLATLGVRPMLSWRAGDAADAISVAQATRRIDR